MSVFSRMFKMLRRLASWDERRLRKLEKLLDSDTSDEASALVSLLGTPEFSKQLKRSLANQSLDSVIGMMLEHRSQLRTEKLRSLCHAPEATFLAEARIENLASDPARIRIGTGTFIRGELLAFRFGGQLTMGKHGYLGENSRVWAGEQVSIGDHVLISHDVFITDCNAHEFDAAERAATFQVIVSKGHPLEKGSVETKPVVIEDHVWINPQSVILPGVRIGTGSIIGAGSVVTRDVPPNVLAAGNPATVIKDLPKPASAA